MRDALDNLLIEAQRSARNAAFDAAIEMCKMVQQLGGCAKCCTTQIEMLKRDMHASDLTSDALEKARHG